MGMSISNKPELTDILQCAVSIGVTFTDINKICE